MTWQYKGPAYLLSNHLTFDYFLHRIFTPIHKFCAFWRSIQQMFLRDFSRSDPFVNKLMKEKKENLSTNKTLTILM